MVEAVCSPDHRSMSAELFQKRVKTEIYQARKNRNWSHLKRLKRRIVSPTSHKAGGLGPCAGPHHCNRRLAYREGLSNASLVCVRVFVAMSVDRQCCVGIKHDASAEVPFGQLLERQT